MVGNSSTAEDSPVANGTGKRKSDSSAQPHTRAKRNRYISIAWFVLIQYLYDALETHKSAVTSASDAKQVTLSEHRRRHGQMLTRCDADQMQWRHSLPKMRKPVPGMRVCPKLLRRVSEGFGVC